MMPWDAPHAPDLTRPLKGLKADADDVENDEDARGTEIALLAMVPPGCCQVFADRERADTTLRRDTALIALDLSFWDRRSSDLFAKAIFAKIEMLNSMSYKVWKSY